MNREKYSLIGHTTMKYYNPISEEKLHRILSFTNMSENARILDVGCGKGTILNELITKYNVQAYGFDLSEKSIEAGRQTANELGHDKLQLEVQDGSKWDVKKHTNSFDVSICIGSTHVLGGYENTLEKLQQVTKTGGYILIGEGYWKKTPSEQYLQALHATEDEMLSHFGNIQLAEKVGLVTMCSFVTNDDEWDMYEGQYAMNLENYCFNNPDDEDCGTIKERIRAWKKTYYEYGRDTLGFALYLFRKM